MVCVFLPAETLKITVDIRDTENQYEWGYYKVQISALICSTYSASARLDLQGTPFVLGITEIRVSLKSTCLLNPPPFYCIPFKIVGPHEL